MAKKLPLELTQLVDWSVTSLGLILKDELGEKGFRRIENIRRLVKSKQGQSLEGLEKLKKDLSPLSKTAQFEIAHAFALMLELINSCEAAYRTYRLVQERQTDYEPQNYGRVIHVLTAHPTESRNPDVIFYFKKIQEVLEKRLEQPMASDQEKLCSLLKWVWRIPMSKQRKPSVMDEADYIYSLALQKEVISLYIEQQHRGYPFYIRTWVGGDKDGHPGVNEVTMLGSLQRSRKALNAWCLETLEELLRDLKPLAHGADVDRVAIRDLYSKAGFLRRDLKKLSSIKKNDASSLHRFRNDLIILDIKYKI